MVQPLNHIENWNSMSHCKQGQINYDFDREKESWVYHNYKAGNKVMLKNHQDKILKIT